MRRPQALRSTSQSPVRHRISDDLLSCLSPASAYEALRSPTGTLKACLDHASVSEQSFALRTAVASKKIFEWHDELSDWDWPTSSTSAGFEMLPAKRRKLSITFDRREKESSKPRPETEYLGCLPVHEVARYEQRLEKIQQGLDELNLEEIKAHVLHNHIAPLSRPGTPFSDSGRSVTSMMAFSKLEDLGAVMTAITVQALPTLSRLSRLLNIWHVRLVVLRKVPSVLLAIMDAEIALESGYNAIAVSRRASQDLEGDGDEPSVSVLSRSDFEVMKSVLQHKVAKPGRDLDFMLDALEGMEDTLPNEWLDRMEAVERDYVEWAATAEQQIREAEWARNYGYTKAQSLAMGPIGSDTPRPMIKVHQPSPIREQGEFPKSEVTPSPPTPFDHSDMETDSTGGASLEYQSTGGASLEDQHQQPSSPELKILIDAPKDEMDGSASQVLDLTELAAHQRDNDSGALLEDHSFDGSSDRHVSGSTESESSLLWSDADYSTTPVRPKATLRPSPVITQKSTPDLEADYAFLEVVDEEDEEPELPPARFERRDSLTSMASTTIHNPASSLDQSDVDYREDLEEREFPRLPDPDEPLSSSALSPPSSPPLRYKPRSTSVTFKDLPEVVPSTEFDVTPPRSPLDPPEVFDAESSFDYTSQMSSPSRSVVSVDDQLHMQISEVLKSLPNKFRLSSRSKAVNLNPPDLQLPSRPKPKTSDPFRRSESAMSTMSSRSGTPAFLLAPAKSSRPRSRNSQEARTYLLSRSPNEQPMRLLIRCVGENGERVMVRVGGGWADLAEYLKEYAIHHGRRSKGEGKVEVTDLPVVSAGRAGSSPPSRPVSAMDSPMTPLAVRKTRRSLGEEGLSKTLPITPMSLRPHHSDTPPSDGSNESRLSATRHHSWIEDDNSVLGLSGPKPKSVAILSEESRAWVEHVKSKVRTASGESRLANTVESLKSEGKLGEMDKVGATKRLFRKNIR